MYCNVDKYAPLFGKSYIDLPNFIKNKNCCINVKNKDNCCFLWAIFSCLYYDSIAKNHDRTSSYSKENFEKAKTEMEKRGIEFPFLISEGQVKKVEKMFNVSFNIYTFDAYKKHVIVILYICLVL